MMKRILFALLFITMAFSQFANDMGGWKNGAFYVPDGTVYSEGAIVVDEGTLAAESLSEINFTTHVKWDVTNDFVDSGGNAAYTWSLNQTSTLTQIQANLATAGVDAVWYLFTYTVAVTTAFDGDGAATITTGFASGAVSLDLSVGTHSVYFKSKTTPVDFVISVVSGTDTEGTWTIDDVTLKQITGGSVDISGVLLVRGVDIGAGVGASTDDQKIDVFSISGDNVQLSLEDDAEATKTADISTTTAVAANTAKNTNVSTELSVGTVGVNTVAITSDGGADDVTLPAALVGSAGLLTTAKWAEIVANNAKVTNTDDQKIDVFSIAGDNVQLSLESDGEATKTVDISTTTAVAANSAKNTNVSTTLSIGTTNANTVSITSDGGADDVTIPAAINGTAGLLTDAKWDEIVANNAKVVGTHPVATVYVPSSDQARLDDSAITIANTIVRVVGDGGAVILDTAPSISDGAADGQMVVIQGTSDANIVTIADNTNCQLAGGVDMTLGKGDTIHLIWDSGDSDWYELNRSDN